MKIPLKNRLERGVARGIAAATRDRPNTLRLYFDSLPLDTDTFLRGVLLGYFLFPDTDGTMRWRSPKERGVILVDEFIVPKKMRSSVRKHNYKIRVDHNPNAALRRSP